MNLNEMNETFERERCDYYHYLFFFFFLDTINYYEIPIYHFFRIATAHRSASCVEPDKENSYNVKMVLQSE